MTRQQVSGSDYFVRRQRGVRRSGGRFLEEKQLSGGIADENPWVDTQGDFIVQTRSDLKTLGLALREVTTQGQREGIYVSQSPYYGALSYISYRHC